MASNNVLTWAAFWAGKSQVLSPEEHIEKQETWEKKQALQQRDGQREYFRPWFAARAPGLNKTQIDDSKMKILPGKMWHCLVNRAGIVDRWLKSNEEEMDLKVTFKQIFSGTKRLTIWLWNSMSGFQMVERFKQEWILFVRDWSMCLWRDGNERRQTVCMHVCVISERQWISKKPCCHTS